jgi:hypothetical protein
MRSNSTSIKNILTITTTLAAILGIIFSTTIPHAFAFEVSPPNKQLTAKWWEWVLAIPPEVNPLTDVDGGDCDIDQKGPVWYLAGTTGGSADRECTIPEGKDILFPIINVFCSEIVDEDTIKDLLNIPPEEDIPPSQLKRGLIACAEFFMDQVDILEVTIDGEEISGLEDFRVQSPLFKIVYPEDNVFGVETTTEPQKSISDGFWILLRGLEPGEHTIEFTGGISTFPFETSVTYHLTIEPKQTTSSLSEEGSNAVLGKFMGKSRETSPSEEGLNEKELLDYMND